VRFLSLLTDVQQAIALQVPQPDNGVWEFTRNINYHKQIARLNLGVRSRHGDLQIIGMITVQLFELTEGNSCVKAHMSYLDYPETKVVSIYPKEGIDWKVEAKHVSDAWFELKESASQNAESHKNSPEVTNTPSETATESVQTP
jgi:hypothetical protein